MRALERRLHRSDGVARVTSLQAAGHSRHQVRRALADGRLVRLRRDWVALPGADHELTAAAAAGVVLTCVSQARRLGLWTMTDPGLHVATGGHGAVPPIAARVHWAKPIVPRHPDALTDPVENVLALVAACRPFEEALVVWESALRKGLAARDALARLPLGPAARRLLEVASTTADSGLETFRSRGDRRNSGARALGAAGNRQPHPTARPPCGPEPGVRRPSAGVRRPWPRPAPAATPGPRPRGASGAGSRGSSPLR
ncbi:hypothetical protein [Agromyces sp. NPDC058064]|uniref:hypothetical protein n=1 Tax=Agromyces sp. NPDC058064 TaxID=3346322 RepID=UPI0036DE25CA